MKKLITITMILLFSTFLNAQSNYENDWKQVQEHENNGLPKSALAVVENIYAKAKATNNAPQIIKSVLYKSKYAMTLEEDAQLKIVNQLKTEIEKANSPEKNMLESILANLYWQFFQQNRYKFYNRTNTTEKVDKTDFRTWDLHTIFTEIDTHFQNALQNGLILKQTKLDTFDAILHLQDGSKNYRPTVYDFIAQKALQFYKTGESNLAQPSYKFEIENPDFLGDNKTFVQADFNSKDIHSQKLQALKIYKELTLFHLKDKNKTALVDLTLQRLDFVKQNARFNNKESVYFETLKKLQKAYRNTPISTEIDFRIAQYYQQKAYNYAENKEAKYQFLNTKALEVCDLAISKFPKSNGANKCLNLKNAILKPNIQLQNEGFIEVNKENKLLITYKNLDQVYFRVFKSDRSFEYKLQREYDKSKILSKISNQSKVIDFSSTLKNEKDYQQHSTEVILPKLSQGEYVILASPNADFSKNNFAYGFIQVTNLAFIETINNGNYTWQVVHRFNGKPVSNANVHIHNYNISNYNKKIDKHFITDTNGFVHYKPKNHHNSVAFTVTKNDEKANFRYYRLYQNGNRSNDNSFTTNRVFLFTDRSIYRLRKPFSLKELQ